MYYLLFNDDICDYIENYKNDIIETLTDEGITPTDSDITSQAAADIEYYADELKNALNSYDNIKDYDKILIVGSLGLWYGRRNIKAYCNTLYEAITKAAQDVNKIYFVKKNSTMAMDAAHHDGINNYKFYKVIRGRKYAIKADDITGVM